MKKICQVLYVFLTFAVLFGCSTTPQQNGNTKVMSKSVTQLKNWKISGKIAFINGKQKDSANIHWQVNQTKQQQKLSLTTYLGISVLSLNSNANQHTLVVDGKSYQSDNLQQLLFNLTRFQLPVNALQFWIKGIAKDDIDQVFRNPKTGLTEKILSYEQGRIWQIQYANYQPIQGVMLPKSLVLTSGSLKLKLKITSWQLAND